MKILNNPSLTKFNFNQTKLKNKMNMVSMSKSKHLLGISMLILIELLTIILPLKNSLAQIVPPNETVCLAICRRLYPLADEYEMGRCMSACLDNYNNGKGFLFEPIHIHPGVLTPVSFARIDSTGTILTGQGNILNAEYYALRIDSLEVDSLPMHHIGSGNFNNGTNTWDLSWMAPYYQSSDNLLKGYIIKVEFNDSELGIREALGFLIFSPPKVKVTLIPEGFLYAASINTTRSNIKDKAIISLRSSTHPYSLVDRDTVVIDSITLSGNCYFNNTLPGNYYIQVKHRNSIETWSANPVAISADSTYYDFTSAASQSYGNNMVLKLGKWCIFSGDVNQNGVVDIADAAIIDNDTYNFVTGYVNSDLNGDGVVDASDMTISDNNSYNFVSAIFPSGGGTTHYIGESYGGGIVFYVDGTGQHGLIAAPSNQSSGITWWNGFYVLIGTTSTAIGTGQTNTNSIINAQGAGNYAASICDNLTLNGYSDWFLPSAGELNLMYIQKSVIGGFANDNYFSSSEYNFNYVWSQDFINGNFIAGTYKSTTNYVRAIRSF